MRIIPAGSRYGRSRSLLLRRWTRALVSLCVLGLPLGTGVAFGYMAGQQQPSVSDDAISRLKQKIQSQRAELDGIRGQSEQYLAAMAVRMANLQARLVRLDALGERMTGLAKLDSGEFDFSQPPAVGGPEIIGSSDLVGYGPVGRDPVYRGPADRAPADRAPIGRDSFIHDLINLGPLQGDTASRAPIYRGAAYRDLANRAPVNRDPVNRDSVNRDPVNRATVGQADLFRAIEELADRIDNREQQLAILESLLANRKLEDETFLAGRPIRTGWMSSRYGLRNDPFTGRVAQHGGVDFAGPEGSEIISVAAGVVTWSGNRHGYGTMVEINHGGGYMTRYAHNRENWVKVGDVIKKGQVIALMGSSGRSTGPHVHFEVYKHGRPVDPATYIHRAAR